MEAFWEENKTNLCFKPPNLVLFPIFRPSYTLSTWTCQPWVCRWWMWTNRLKKHKKQKQIADGSPEQQTNKQTSKLLITSHEITEYITLLGRTQTTFVFLCLVCRWCDSAASDWSAGGLLHPTPWLPPDPCQPLWDGKV